jgi:uncharacterized protein YjbI with pentapeptide repeats
MANEEHLAILRQEVEVWNKWRKEHLDTRLWRNGAELYGADLREANLARANLSLTDFTMANLREASLRGADLRGARLMGADLSGALLIGTDLVGADLTEAKLVRADLTAAKLVRADLTGADLTGAILIAAKLVRADLTRADLTRTDLTRTDFRDANLCEVNLTKASLNEADLSRAQLLNANFENAAIGRTIFDETDLSSVRGLATVRHFAPATIGIDTLFSSDSKIPNAFLHGCGVPDSLIEYLPSLLGAMHPIQFYSCFISHSSKDDDFARRLHERMRAEHLRVWFAPEDLRGGQKLHEQIDQAIRVYDKLVLILSEASIHSEWVQQELRRARQAEIQSQHRKLFPIRLVDFDALQNWECLDSRTGGDLAEEVREYYIPDFTRWKDHDSFERAFARLLKDLQATEAPPIPRQSAPVQPTPPITDNADDPLSRQAERKHLRDIIGKKTRRLRHLEEREAVQGIATDPKDRIEIADLRREIGELEDRLRKIHG